MQMATKISVEFEGFEEFKELTTQITNDFGYKDASNMMVAAVRLSMRSALDAARSRVPVDTGALRASLQIEARKPRNKDRKSKYIQNGDVAIAIITTAPGKKLAKMKFQNQRTGTKQSGVKSDARATIMEFGSATTPAQPYLRPALESSSGELTRDLSKSLREALEKYKVRQAKKRKIV
jgi:HK97 gp10 family phage protein